MQVHGGRTTSTISSTHLSASSAEARRRQVLLWEKLLVARYLAIVVLALAALLAVDELGDTRFWVSGALVALALPYNLALQLHLRRTGSLTPMASVTDQLAGALAVVAFADLYMGLLVVLLSLSTFAAVAHGRRVAELCSTIGGAAAIAVTVASPADHPWPWTVTYLVATALVVHVVGTVADVERHLRTRHAELMDGIDAIVWEQLTTRPSTLAVNARAEELFGYPVEAWAEPGFWRRHTHAEDVDRIAHEYRDTIRRGESRVLEYRMLAADGRTVHVQDRMRVDSERGRATKVRGVMLDVTEAKVAEAQARQYLHLVDRISLALLVLRRPAEGHPELHVVAANPEAARVCAVDLVTLVGMRLGQALPAMSDRVLEGLAEVSLTGRPFSAEDLRLTAGRTGDERLFSLFAFPLPDAGVGVSIQDVTERLAAAEVLRHQALHDGLTGLPNRTALVERLRYGLRGPRSSAALLVLDLNEFKEVNDALGHAHGDRLLVELSRRLEDVLDDVDLLARLGGDEYAVLLTEDVSIDTAHEVAERIRASMEEPVALDGIDVQTSASIGIALFPDHAQDPDILVQRAEVAMYLAKRRAADIAVYSPDLDRSSVRRITLLGELRRAIHDGELELHYQPSLDLRTGEVGSVEALVRWRHPEHGLIPPSEFIELAEISGLIGELTRWVLAEAVRSIRTWESKGLRIRVAVNLSVRNLADPTLVPWLADLLERAEVDPALVKLEVTESELMDDPAAAMATLESVRSLGSSTSIDDFGTGYSSLAYLKHLPVDELKIDRSFVAGMAGGDSDLTIVRSTIDLAHNLGLDVVAEGVEDAATLRRLAELGCDRAQGYFISRPVPAAACTIWLTDRSGLAEVATHLPSAADPIVLDDVPAVDPTAVGTTGGPSA